MVIEYEFSFNNIKAEEFENYLKGMPYFEKYDSETCSFIYRKQNSKYLDAVIELHEIGIYLTDYLTGFGRELMGLLIEHITGEYGEVEIDERD